MPLVNDSDQYGVFFQWGLQGKKYYYIRGDAKSRNEAKRKAIRQMRAIEFNRGKYKI